MSPLAGPPAKDTLATAGAVAVPPFTLWFVELAMAWVPRPSVAFVAPSRIVIVPLFSVSALAPMLMPSASTSAACTTWKNQSALEPLPLL